MTKNVIIDIKNLSTGYKKDKFVSKGLNLQVYNSEFIVLVGPNGCGKSTLFRTIAGLQKPLNGDISVKNKSINSIGIREKALLFSLVLTDKIQTENIKVYDIVSMGRYPYVGIYGNLSAKDKEIINSAINSCQIHHLRNKLFSHLSDGEKQRVMIARALSQQTPIMMLDEPTAHLDIPNKINIILMLKDLAEKFNKSIITITHDLDFALSWSNRVWLMDKNGNVYDGVPEDIVLNNYINEVFQSDKVSFDINNGNFSPNIHYNETTALLKSQSNRKIWIHRALNRNGIKVEYDETKHYDFIIYDDNENIIIDNKKEKTSLNSVEKLLDYIKEKLK